MPAIITIATRLAIMLPMPHSLCQGSSGFLMRSLSRYVMTDPPGYTRFLQNQRRLSTSIAATEGLPQSRLYFDFSQLGCQPVRGRHKFSDDVQARGPIFNSTLIERMRRAVVMMAGASQCRSTFRCGKSVQTTETTSPGPPLLNDDTICIKELGRCRLLH